MKKKWTLGTRGSKLALRQTAMVIEELHTLYPACEFSVKTIKTTGDTVWDKPLHTIGEKGLFVREIEEALQKGDIDLAVHSMKDLPADLPEGLTIGAILKREDPRDALIASAPLAFTEIRPGSRIGTNSLRRKSQILHVHPSAEIVPIRGNVDTRIGKLATLDLDAVVLALAGVKRMGYMEWVKDVLSLDLMVPPSGQGAIGIESRNEEAALLLLEPLDHAPSRTEVTVERMLQTMIGGGCSIPLGINAALAGDDLTLRAAYGDENGLSLAMVKEAGKVSDTQEIVSAALRRLNAGVRP